MSFPPEFKKELLKALRLSVFLTVILFGVLVFGASRYADPRVVRSIASDSSTGEVKGVRESSSRRAVPPYERAAP